MTLEQKGTGSIVETARECKAALDELIARSPSSTAAPQSPERSEDLPARSRAALQSLAALIESTNDPSQLEEMLTLNDELTSLLARVNARRPELKRLKGLGISVEHAKPPSEIIGNGLQDSPDHLSPGEEEEDEPVTPRIDKGKGRAEPEPEEPQPVLSPSLMMPDYDLEEGEANESLLETVESIVSPTDRYVYCVFFLTLYFL